MKTRSKKQTKHKKRSSPSMHRLAVSKRMKTASRKQEERPADDHPMSKIPIVDLDRDTYGGADLHRVRDALLYAGFGVAMHTSKDVKEERGIDNLNDYCQLWD
ncbi:hypothetical protein R1flu_004747 [Riccia fluitans]|uniref:Uncharacterized protein n=1 Tax=Riccia fluitans TaxID=41844 RepID=A0ABD1YRH4_9MARC